MVNTANNKNNNRRNAYENAAQVKMADMGATTKICNYVYQSSASREATGTVCVQFLFQFISVIGCDCRGALLLQAMCQWEQHNVKSFSFYKFDELWWHVEPNGTHTHPQTRTRSSCKWPWCGSPHLSHWVVYEWDLLPQGNCWVAETCSCS